MELFIKKNSTEPILKMKLVGDSTETVKEFYERIQSSTITFSMKDSNGTFKIYKKKCGLILKESTSDINDLVYHIYYRWEAEDTDEPGVYEGEFEIKFYNAEQVYESTLIAPIREKLLISVLN